MPQKPSNDSKLEYTQKPKKLIDLHDNVEERSRSAKEKVEISDVFF